MSALRELEILDTEDDPAFNAIVELAAHVAGVPIALVSLVDENRQWFKARVGLGAAETSRDVSFCAHAVVDGERLVVRDAQQDDRFRGNPLVQGDPFIRFYAGVPLRLDDLTLGTLCVIDSKPRELSEQQLEMLSRLGEQVLRLLELRVERRHAQEEQALIRELYAIASGAGDAGVRIERVLAFGCDRFGAELGIVSQINDASYLVEHVDDRAGTGLEVGTELLLGNTFCSLVLATGEPVHIANVERSAHQQHPAYEATRLQSYLGAKVLVDGAPFGTLNFSSRNARERAFDELDIEALQLMAAWVGTELSRARGARQRNELIAELESKILRLSSLEELIPICSWCQRVRDDESWGGLQSYVQSYTAAKFSHGICPTCRDEHFPETS